MSKWHTSPPLRHQQQDYIRHGKHCANYADGNARPGEVAIEEIQPQKESADGNEPQQLGQDVEQEGNYRVLAGAKGMESAEQEKGAEQDGDKVGTSQSQQPFWEITHIMISFSLTFCLYGEDSKKVGNLVLSGL